MTVTVSDDALRQYTPADGELNPLALIDGLEFSNGVIEAEIAGAPAPGVGEGARGFVGIAFRMQKDMRTYDAFYLRPTNGRAEDQVRRNHSVQYISHPAWPWQRLRKETPERYEASVDLEPGVWTKVKIDVRGAVALWVGPGTIAHFRNVRIRRYGSRPGKITVKPSFSAAVSTRSSSVTSSRVAGAPFGGECGRRELNRVACPQTMGAEQPPRNIPKAGCRFHLSPET